MKIQQFYMRLRRKGGNDMKNHVYQNGRLIQTNKKFSALKQKQQEWITNELR
jgi:hypothetical protein